MNCITPTRMFRKGHGPTHVTDVLRTSSGCFFLTLDLQTTMLQARGVDLGEDLQDAHGLRPQSQVEERPFRFHMTSAGPSGHTPEPRHRIASISLPTSMDRPPSIHVWIVSF